MIDLDTRNKLWRLIGRVAWYNKIIIPPETKDEFIDYMRANSQIQYDKGGEIKYFLVDFYHLGEGFYFHAFYDNELNEIKGDKFEGMFERYFKEESKPYWDNLLLIDMKGIKGYYLSKEIKIKYNKKPIK